MKLSQHRIAGVSAPTAVIVSALIGVLGGLLGAFLTPLGQRLVGPSAPTPSLPQASQQQNTQESGCADLGNQQLCWGQIPILPAGSDAHIRAFSFTFAKQFKMVPAITTGINVVGNGYTFAVYRGSVTETAYTGFLVEAQSRNTDVPVSMSYTAIGERR
jgi:hypothetical protein